MNDQERFELWLRKASNGQKMNALLRSQWNIMNALNIVIENQDDLIDIGEDQMANFTELAATVTKIKGTVDSGKAVLRDLRIKIEELAAASNDEADQAAISALAAELGAAETALAEAIATPGTGGSTLNV